MKRRDFIQKTSLATAGVMAAPSLMANPQEKLTSFGFQAYTVRDVIYKDMPGTLKKLRKAGYDYMELFDFQRGKILGKPVKEAKTIFAKSKLKVKSIHVATGSGANIPGTLNTDFQMAIDGAKELGAEYLVCPYLTSEERKNIDQYKELAELLNRCGEKCQRAGLGFGYHNHEFEFETLDGEIPYEVILNETEADLVKMELDIYWARYAEEFPINLFKANKGRYPLWHVKDLSLDKGKPMTEVGNGIIEWGQLFRHQDNSGLKYFFVEQDRNFKESSVKSLITSIKYLKKLTF